MSRGELDAEGTEKARRAQRKVEIAARLLELIDEMQVANPDAEPCEVMQDVLAAQQAVRD
jgi:hypothetical protein